MRVIPRLKIVKIALIVLTIACLGLIFRGGVSPCDIPNVCVKSLVKTQVVICVNKKSRLECDSVLSEPCSELEENCSGLKAPRLVLRTSSINNDNNQSVRTSIPQHVVFTTGRTKALSKLDQVIRNNSELAAGRLPRTTSLFFPGEDSSLPKNHFGYPILRSIYLRAMQLFPGADTYTYYNQDLIFNESFVTSLDVLVYSARAGNISGRFLAVGLRTNVSWKENMTVTKESFEHFLRKGEEFRPDAQDYFVSSPTLWDWRQIPPFVIGRVAYDNWLVNKAVITPGVATIDISKTSPVIHQTGLAGNYQGHSGGDNQNIHYNTYLGKKQWAKGQIYHCGLCTTWENGLVTVQKRK